MKSQTKLSNSDKPIHNHLSHGKSKKQIETERKVFWFSLFMVLAAILIAGLVDKCNH